MYLRCFPDTQRRCSATDFHDSQKTTAVSREPNQGRAWWSRRDL